jgi:hypothetical protein
MISPMGMNEMPVDGVFPQIDDAFLQADPDQRGTRIENSKRHRVFSSRTK